MIQGSCLPPMGYNPQCNNFLFPCQYTRSLISSDVPNHASTPPPFAFRYPLKVRDTHFFNNTIPVSPPFLCKSSRYLAPSVAPTNFPCRTLTNCSFCPLGGWRYLCPLVYSTLHFSFHHNTCDDSGSSLLPSISTPPPIPASAFLSHHHTKMSPDTTSYTGASIESLIHTPF